MRTRIISILIMLTILMTGCQAQVSNVASEVTPTQAVTPTTIPSVTDSTSPTDNPSPTDLPTATPTPSPTAPPTSTPTPSPTPHAHTYEKVQTIERLASRQVRLFLYVPNAVTIWVTRYR